ncbi:NAD-dependent epimerase/dehydratase family protein [Salinilacihabitans rarus]|uniref:NAD-dependent epimerase/dehydratase family protein n=1 Tax=Salinilacihabitans rarus TaxID=2961596 RepID=UPI0020C938E7|nr:NAD-dependent epimerase/dehydratase family protein [Salinilacihabitans rarus]
MTPESILVTGSSGMIGTALVERLHAEGYDVTGVDVTPNRWSDEVDAVTELVDLRERGGLDDLSSEFDAIIHLGAHARVHRLVERPELAMENVTMTFNLLEFARENGISKFVFASSREVYGNTDRVVYDESATYADTSESPYTASKIGGESMVTAYGQCYDLTTTIVRLSNVYGRYDAADRVVPLFVARCHEDLDLIVYGANKVLDFTYIDDCVDGLYGCIERHHKVADTTLNIASGQGTSLIELARRVADLTSNESEIVVESTRTGEVSRYVADIGRARRVLDYDPRYPFSAGIEETVDWYVERPAVLERILSNSSASGP